MFYLLEDIVDTGQTKNLRDMFKEREAASVKSTTLLDHEDIVKVGRLYLLYYQMSL